MSQLTKMLCQAVWDELEPILENYANPHICEAQLMAYFPSLKLTSLMGTTFLRDNEPLNFVPYGSSFLLLEESLPDQKLFYVFVLLRRPIEKGIRIDYLLPYIEWNDEIRVENFEIEVDSENGREKIIEVELKIPQFATEWLEAHETF